MNESQWLKAWDNFLAIYVTKFAHLLPDLLAYAGVIRNLISNKFDFILYDTNFRIAREHTKCSWATLRVDLQMQAMQSRLIALSSGRPIGRERAFRSVPTSYCFSFHNREKFCSSKDCAYKHSCPTCNGPHPVYMCRSGGSNSPPFPP